MASAPQPSASLRPRLPPRGLALALAAALAACKPAPPADAPAGNPERAVEDVVQSATETLAAADAEAEVRASMEKLLAAGAFRATLQGPGGQIMTMEHVAPDRYRISLPAGTQVVIGDTMYMSMQGRTTRVPVPPGTVSQWREPFDRVALAAEALGRDPVEGVPARRYRIRQTGAKPTDIELWIDEGGYPLQVRVNPTEPGGQPTVLRYSGFNDPGIRIDPPE